MANDRVKGAGAVAILVVAAVLAALLPRRDPEPVSTILPSDDAAVATGLDAGVIAADAADADNATTLENITATTRGLPTAACEEQLQKRRARAEALELANIGQDAVAILQHSGDTEHVLAAALMNPDRRQLQELLDRVLAADPGNRIAHWKNLENCHARGSECDRDQVEAGAIAADGANGLVWLDTAATRLREERWAEAEDALRQAAAAPRFDTYFMEYALLIERGLAATSEMDYTERMIAAIGHAAAAAIPAYDELTRRCSGRADGFRLPADTCFELGEQMARHSPELVSKLIGMSLQRDAASRRGDAQLVEALEREAKELRAAVLGESAASGALVLLENDAAVLQRYVDMFLAHGEIRAAEHLVAEARRLRADPDYDQCNFFGNRAFEPRPAAPD